MATEIDRDEYRVAMGCFATGVAVVTTCDADGARAGLTISSINSVSLDPPLVLWSIAHDSLSYSTFMAAEFFAVNVLAMNQQDMSARFAKKGRNKFEGLNCSIGINGAPILSEYSAVYECRTEFRYDGGDHKIIVGRVLKFEDRGTDPLIFYRGHFLAQEFGEGAI
jgi:3-hydroxy-9,10-secoandrosta-1,3,5(10)-triene-9,17-dione monooxygenase reductase component